MRFLYSFPDLAIIGTAWTAVVSAQPPPPYPDTRTLVKLQPSQVETLGDPDYNLWKIDSSDVVSHFSTNGLEFTLKATSEGDSLIGDANAPVYTAPLPDVGQRLIGSGITTASLGGSVTLTISGLPAGEHWLSTWHNAWDGLDDIPSVGLVIDGTSGISGRPQSSQETNRYENALIHSWTTFTSDGNTTEVEYRPRDGNVFINGFEVDSESMGRQIRFPQPAHRDEQVNVSGGTVSTSWERTFNVDGDRFNVYIGTSPDNMELVGSLVQETGFEFTGLSPGTKYYWRVDAYDTWWDEALSGRTLTFTTL